MLSEENKSNKIQVLASAIRTAIKIKRRGESRVGEERIKSAIEDLSSVFEDINYQEGSSNSADSLNVAIKKALAQAKHDGITKEEIKDAARKKGYRNRSDAVSELYDGGEIRSQYARKAHDEIMKEEDELPEIPAGRRINTDQSAIYEEPVVPDDAVEMTRNPDYESLTTVDEIPMTANSSYISADEASNNTYANPKDILADQNQTNAKEIPLEINLEEVYSEPVLANHVELKEMEATMKAVDHDQRNGQGLLTPPSSPETARGGNGFTSHPQDQNLLPLSEKAQEAQEKLGKKKPPPNNGEKPPPPVPEKAQASLENLRKLKPGQEANNGERSPPVPSGEMKPNGSTRVMSDRQLANQGNGIA